VLGYYELIQIGNITNGILKEKLNKMQPKNVNEIAGCKNCWVRYLCGGGCFSEKILTNQQSGTLSEDECKLKQFYWNFILNLYIASETERVNLQFMNS
jgi:radical SAM protein with 4Fe4S-binding SPASM domain